MGSVYLRFHQPPYADQYYAGKGGLACADPVSATFNGLTENATAVRMSYAAPSPCPATGGGTGGTGGTGGAGGATGTGGSGGGGGTGAPGAPVSSAAILAVLRSGITPAGRAGRIAAILKAGGYALMFDAPESGTALVSWYLLPAGAHLASARHARTPVLIASGRRSFSAAGAQRVLLKLTAAGKALLRHARRVKLTAKGTFTPTGGVAVTTMKAFTVGR